MASVYYLIDDALHIADDIVQKYSLRDKNLKENHFAAIIIQRSYRGYVVRKKLDVLRRAAIILQKYIRGWLVRYYLPDRLQERYDELCVELYNKMAKKIQAYWRGVLVRREINIKEIIEGKRIAEKQALRIFRSSIDVKRNEDDTTDSEHQKDEESLDGGAKCMFEDIYKERILEILFDRHHLLSTSSHKGVLTNNSELAEIEKVLAKLPWRNYMKKLRRMYNKYYEEEKNAKPVYMFTDKKLRKQEDMFRLRDRRNDKKEMLMTNCTADNRKPFILNSKLDEHSYERYILRQGKYFVPETKIVRTEDKSKNICERDFELTLRKVVKESDVPPYYADFWYKECNIHNFV